MKRPDGFEPPKPPVTREQKNSPRTDAPQTKSAETKSTAKTFRRKPKSAGEPQSPVDSNSVRPSKDAADARRLARLATRERRRVERDEVRRFTRRARNRRAAWFTAIALVAVLAVTLIVAIYSPILALRTIRVEGASRIHSGDIQKALDHQLGTPLALLNFSLVDKELAAFPLIRNYTTETIPPNTMVVHIVERQPVGQIATSTGFDLVDPAGVVISSSATRVASLPLIDPAGKSTKSAVFRSMGEVLLSLPQTLLAKVDTITAQTPDDVTLSLVGTGQSVVWGSANNSQEKSRVLAALFAQQGAGGAGQYDVSAPGTAVFRQG